MGRVHLTNGVIEKKLIGDEKYVDITKSHVQNQHFFSRIWTCYKDKYFYFEH